MIYIWVLCHIKCVIFNQLHKKVYYPHALFSQNLIFWCRVYIKDFIFFSLKRKAKESCTLSITSAHLWSYFEVKSFWSYAPDTETLLCARTFLMSNLNFFILQDVVTMYIFIYVNLTATQKKKHVPITHNIKRSVSNQDS